MLLQFGLVLGDTITNTTWQHAFDNLLNTIFTIFFIVYLVFAFIVIRQVKNMSSTLETTFSPVIQLFSYAHFILAVGLLIFFLVL